MAVELKIKVRENCDSLYLFDITGKFDLKCNKTGWCAPNEEIDDVTAAEFQIYPPNTTTAIIVDVFPDLPSFDDLGFEILPVDLGMEVFKSGIWRFDYFVRINGVLFTVSCSKLLVEDLRCCLSKEKVPITVDNFESKEVAKSNDLNALFEAALCNSKEGLTAKAQKIIDFLYNQCNCSC